LVARLSRSAAAGSIDVMLLRAVAARGSLVFASIAMASPFLSLHAMTHFLWKEQDVVKSMPWVLVVMVPRSGAFLSSCGGIVSVMDVIMKVDEWLGLYSCAT